MVGYGQCVHATPGKTDEIHFASSIIFIDCAILVAIEGIHQCRIHSEKGKLEKAVETIGTAKATAVIHNACYANVAAKVLEVLI